MNNCSDLVIIFDRILKRVNQGAENYTTISNYIARRAEIEDKIAELLKNIIPEKYDNDDPITRSFMQSINEEVDSHVSFSNELKKELISKNNIYIKTLLEKQKSIRDKVEKSKNKAQKAINNTLKAEKEVELQKSKCKDLTPKQLESQNVRIKKAITDYQNKSKQEVDESLSISASDMPNIYRAFSEFDSIRLRKLHGLTLSFNKFKTDSIKEIVNSADSFNYKLNGFDPDDRSKRYIKRVYDPSVEDVQEDENIDIYAIAISNYRSDDPRDLTFCRGDKIKVLTQHSSGWYEGLLDKKRGFFPISFVILPNDSDNRKDPIGAVFLVNKDCKGPNRNDIQLLQGDLVYVDYCTKGRCSGTNLRNNLRGFFPLSALETNANCLVSTDKDKPPDDGTDWLPEYSDSMELISKNYKEEPKDK